jgi:hypothetical protein
VIKRLFSIFLGSKKDNLPTQRLIFNVFVLY